MNGGPIGTVGMIVTEVEGGIQEDHMIIILMFRGETGVGV